jgi:hypothetical protein
MIVVPASTPQTVCSLIPYRNFRHTRRRRIVHITVPYRFGRLFGRGAGFRWLGELTFLDDTEFDPEPIQLSLDQVERHGPELMVDYRHSSGGQFIAWVE